MPLLHALTCQAIALVITFAVAYWLPIFHHPIVFLLMQCGLAVVGSRLLRQPKWWIFIHLLFLPSIFIFFTFSLPAWFYLIVVMVLSLIFWGTIRGDVPLFLSSSEVARAVIDLLQQEQAQTFADLGAGVGSVAIPIAQQFPELNVEAWELAPLPWLIALWRGKKLANYLALRRNFFVANFNQYDVIFAFLSPMAMPEVSAKVRREMRSGSLFISSSFPVQDWQPENIKYLRDPRKTVLYCYRLE